MCSSCYARRGHYTCRSVKGAHARRLVGIAHPEWVKAMSYLLRAYDERWHRWFDSGDLQGVDHLDKIAAVARRTPHTRHWLPTHETYVVGEWLAAGNTIPANLCIRISADNVEDRPTAPTWDLSTATVHKFKGEPVEFPAGRNASIECRAYTRGNTCGTCRACWDPRVQNVSFPLH